MIKAEHPPIIGIRKVVWLLTSGWVLFSLYALYGVFLAFTIFLIPFAIVMFKFALFALCPVGYTVEPYPEAERDRFWKNPKNVGTMFLNLVWLVVAGWAVCLGLWFGALIQIFTIIGIPSAITAFKLSGYALWPLGRHRVKQIPPPLPPKHGAASGTSSGFRTQNMDTSGPVVAPVVSAPPPPAAVHQFEAPPLPPRAVEVV